MGVEELQGLIEAGQVLKASRKTDPEFIKWQRRVKRALRKLFGEGSEQETDFETIGYTPGSWSMSDPAPAFDRAFFSGKARALAILETCVEDALEKAMAGDVALLPTTKSAEDRISRLLHRFHLVARALRERQRGREALTVNDEYDVQYLLRSLLFIEFDDVRDEDPVPSRGGAPSRVDFLIAEERVVVEVKMVRKGLSDKKLGEELIVDIDRYRAHPTCDRLFCFVYDPDHLLRNPRGLERDLSQTLEGLDVFVFVRPISDWSAKV